MMMISDQNLTISQFFINSISNDLNIASFAESVITSKSLNSPIVLLIFSGFIIHHIRRKWSIKDKKEEEERARKISLRKEQITFLNEIGTVLHDFYPYLFQEIDNCTFHVEKDAGLNLARLNLFKTRFSVFIKSKAYLKDESFSDKIDTIIYDLDNMVSILSDETNERDYLILTQNTLKKVHTLQESWLLKIDKYIEKEKILIENIDVVIMQKINKKIEIIENDFSRVMYYHASCIWLRSRELLEEALNKYVLEG